MSTTVLAPSGLEISSNHDDAASMLESLTPKDKNTSPRVLRDKGVEVKDDKDEHAVALGKKGGEAAAKAKKEAAKAKPADEKPDAKEAKPSDDKGDEKAAEEKAKGKAEGEEEEAEPAKKKAGDPRLDAQARIAELAREKREAREEAARLREELAEARRAPRREAEPAAERREAPATKDDDPEPQEAEFENYADFVKASSRWAARDEHRKVEARTHMERAHNEYKQAVQSDVEAFHERITGLKKDDPGQDAAFHKFMDSLPDEILAPPSIMVPAGQRRPVNLIADIALLSPKSREIYEYFANDINENGYAKSHYQRIATLRTRDEVIAEMAIVRHTLDAATSDTSAMREVSRAGSPPPSVRGTPRAVEPDLSGADFDSHMRQKNAGKK